jgi:putative transposase
MKNLPEAPVKKERISRKTLPPGVAKVMKRLHFPLDIILRCVRWYVAYSLNLRDLEEMIAEHGVEVDHSTVHRWVIKLVPLFEKSFRQHKRPVGKSWRMDETYIKVQGQWKYLYRAVDKDGDTVDFLFRAHRDKAAAQRYFEKAIDQNGAPGTVTVDKSGSNLAALQAINAERETPIKIRQCKYLNNIVEQDHRGHQTDHETDAGLQGFSVRAHHFVRHRGHAYDSERTDAGEKRHPPVSRRAVLLAVM